MCKKLAPYSEPRKANMFVTLLGFAIWITSVPVGQPRMCLYVRRPDRLWLYRPGTRGATSAEYFLKAGYAVIFMHRQFSLQPFSRHYSHSTNPFLDFLEIEPNPDKSSGLKDITVTPSKRDDLLDVLTSYKSVQQAGVLHTLTF